MGIAASELASSLRFFNAVILHAGRMVAVYGDTPRISSIFASQQRWLMAQAGIALHFDRSADPLEGGLYAARFIASVTGHNIASRNTAATFLQEMQAYKLVRPLPDPPDRRIRRLEPTELTLNALWTWLVSHLRSLDCVDDGGRVLRLQSEPDLMTRIQPILAGRILRNLLMRNPGPTFDLYTWANSGGVVMDYLFSRISDFNPEMECVTIPAFSPRDVADRFLISKTHLKRLIGKAAEMGSNGWEGPAGKSRFWLSRGFIREYWDYQAEKCALIDEAFGRVALRPAETRGGLARKPVRIGAS